MRKLYTNGARRVCSRREAYDVLATRPGKWGNPFAIGPDGDRGRVVDLHRRWLKIQPELLADLSELRGKVVGCVCEPDEECHADTLVAMANKGAELMIRVHGWDLSLNHGGFVELDEDGAITWFKYVTDGKAAAEKGRGHGIYMPFAATAEKMKKAGVADKAAMGMARLMWWEHFLDKDILMPRTPTHVAIEDYAIRAEGNSVYQIGEHGGIARALCWFRKIALRLHDPLSVKMFGALSGNASPAQLADAIKERVSESGIDFGDYNNKPRDGDTKNPNLPEYDLSSAYTLAWLALTEVKLRLGVLEMDTLAEKQRQVFNRVTKTYPVNILGREWIADPHAAEKKGEHEHAAVLKKMLQRHQMSHLFPGDTKKMLPSEQKAKVFKDCPTCQALTWAAS